MGADDEILGPDALDGARIQRIDTPRPDTVVLGIRWRAGEAFEKGHLVLSPTGAVLASERPRGEAVDGFGRRLRKLIGGAFVVAVEGRGDRRRVRLARGPRDARQELLLGMEAGQPVLRSTEGKPLAGRTRLRAEAPDPDWERVGVPKGPAAAASAAERSPLAKAGRRRRSALRRTIGAVRKDIARVDQVEGLRERANVLKAHAHQWQPGMDTLEVLDFHADPPVTERWSVDPKAGPSAEADVLFHRARRFERGAELGTQRLASLQEELEALEAWLAREPEDPADREAWEVEARDVGVRGSRSGASRSKRRPAERLPYRRFLGTGSRAVLVGRGAADNDQLTLRHSRPWDLWLHAKGRRGAHVIVPLEKRETCPPGLLVDAAMLAAHFSDAAGDAIVDVSHVPRRHVHKRKGDPPGAVRPSREKVIAVRMDRDRIRSLVATEERV
ncbi:MAG: DUF814 domain-containing protein [Deltaproteobacteria bacterium]|nr:DUF814 domain-containing protein [Deltaproteobacteria bacterium]